MSALAERIAAARWADGWFETCGIRFFLEETPDEAPSDMPSILVLKTRRFFEAYAEELGDAPTERVLDLGVWRGGSALAFAALMDVEKLVAADICAPVAAFDELRARHPLGERISVQYGVSQEDAGAIARIVAAEFDGPLDLIIDDASHDYDLTRRTFEHAFRHLRPGGWYVIEDWGWAHYPRGAEIWTGRPALTNLVFRLSMASHSRPDLFRRVVVRQEAMFIQKGLSPATDGVLDIDACIEMGSRALPALI